MAELVLKMAITLDGLVAGPGGEVAWMSEFADQEEQRHEVATLWNAQAHLMGSRTFNDMRAYWPITAGPVAEAMNAIPKIAFSRRGLKAAGTTKALVEALPSRDVSACDALPSAHAASWDEAEILSGDLAQELDLLKRRDGKPLLVHGGAGFASSVLATGRVDEVRLTVHPIALGVGLGIFDRLEAPQSFQLTSAVGYASGLRSVVLRTRR